MVSRNVLIGVGIALLGVWWFFIKSDISDSLPVGLIVTLNDTSNLWEDLLKYPGGPDIFVKHYQIKQKSRMDHETLDIEKDCEADYDENLFGITRCSSTAWAFSQYLCGCGITGVVGMWNGIEILEEYANNGWKESLEKDKISQSLWEINVHRESAKGIGHVFVLHQYGDQWDVYMSFIQRYKLSMYMKKREKKGKHPMSIQDILNYTAKLKILRGSTKWNTKINNIYNELFHVNAFRDSWISEEVLGFDVSVWKKDDVDKIIVGVFPLCINKLNLVELYRNMTQNGKLF